jgi:hypothetical protein
MSKSNLRVVVRLVLLFMLVFALSLTQGWATTIGSSTTSRSNVDGATGQVYIYDGAFFNSGDNVSTASFNWFGPTFSGSRDLTPLLFLDNDGVFTVEAIGAAETVNGTGAVQSVLFGLQAGTATATGTTYTFGFVTGLADSTGDLSGGTSSGVVTFDPTVDAPPGASGSGTNDWVFTPTDTGITVALGTTFGGNGTALNNPEIGSFNTDRTYSANVSTNASGVAEPGTFSLITGAGLVLAGLFRYRYSRGRQS